MDVVKTNIEELGGTIHVDTIADVGTHTYLRIPPTVQLAHVLVCRVRGYCIGLQESDIERLIRVGNGDEHELRRVPDGYVLESEGTLVPVIDLARALYCYNSDADMRPGYVALLRHEAGGYGIHLDAILDIVDAVMRSNDPYVKAAAIYRGTTVLGDGSVVSVLAPLSLKKKYLASEREATAAARRATFLEEAQQFLLFEGRNHESFAIEAHDVVRVERIDLGQCQVSGGQTVLQYRGDILPIFEPATILPERRRRPRKSQLAEKSGQAPLIVCDIGGRQIGLIVPRLLDFRTERIAVKRPGSRPGVKFCAAFDKRVTEILDVKWIVRTANPTLHAMEHRINHDHNVCRDGERRQ